MLSIIKFPFNLALTSLCMSSCWFKSEYVELRCLQLRSNDGNDTGIVSTGQLLKVVFIVINWLLIQICENSNVSLVLWVTLQIEFNTIALYGNDKTYTISNKNSGYLVNRYVHITTISLLGCYYYCSYQHLKVVPTGCELICLRQVGVWISSRWIGIGSICHHIGEKESFFASFMITETPHRPDHCIQYT